MIILIPIIIAVAVAGYWVYHNYSPQTIQSEANNVINNASNTIQQIPSQISQESNSILQNHTISFTNKERAPIAIYDNCESNIRGDYENEAMRSIGTTCHFGQYDIKQFQFNIPDELKQTMQGSVLLNVKTKVYQYGMNDFEIGLYDQLGEKNYTVTLWQLP